MGPNHCLKYANQCIKIAELTDGTERLSLLSQAKAWLQVADELIGDDALRKRVKDLEVPGRE
jgi:hypothetical protein